MAEPQTQLGESSTAAQLRGQSSMDITHRFPQAQGDSTVEEPEKAQGRPQTLPSQDQVNYLRDPGPVTRWNIPLFDNPFTDCRTSLLGCFCPCVLYGKTQGRLKYLHKGEDPLDDKTLPSCNVPCWIYGVFGFLTWTGIPCFSAICTCTQHSRVRLTYNIEGSDTKDAIKSCCLAQCTLMQAEREFVLRAKRDEKESGNGIFQRPYTTSNQRMRYVPEDRLFGHSLECLTSPKSPNSPTAQPNSQPGQEASNTAANVRAQSPTLPGADGASELHDLDPKGKRRVAHQPHMQVASYVQKETQPSYPVTTEGLTICPSMPGIPAAKAENETCLHISRYPTKIEHRDDTDSSGGSSCGTVNNATPAQPSIAHEQGKAEGDVTTTIEKEPTADGKKIAAGATAGPEEMVYVYYDPKILEQQKLRDVLKTNISESTATSNGPRRGLHTSSTDSSCSGDETLSFVEPTPRAILQPENMVVALRNPPVSEDISAESKSPATAIITEKVVEQPPEQSLQHSLDGSEDTITLQTYMKCDRGSDPRTVSRGFIEPPPIGMVFESPDVSKHPIQHPMTRESVIQPSTPLALEEVAEEMIVNGEWKVPQDGRFGACTLGVKAGRKKRPSFFDGNSEP